jgi:hypothetical protein
MRFFLLTSLLALSACATTQRLPSEVLVPVPVPCEVEQVPATELPQVSPDMNIFDAAKVRMAQLKLLLAENTRLRAANNNPCPAP